jgi:hypothetical protein
MRQWRWNTLAKLGEGSGSNVGSRGDAIVTCECRSSVIDFPKPNQAGLGLLSSQVSLFFLFYVNPIRILAFPRRTANGGSSLPYARIPCSRTLRIS